jgi:hypothetical protein
MAALVFMFAACTAEGRVDYLLGWEDIACEPSPPEDDPGASWIVELEVDGKPRPSIAWVISGDSAIWSEAQVRWEPSRRVVQLFPDDAGVPVTACRLWLAE